jgi:hypothetical protein
MGGREKDGREEGAEKSDRSSSVESGSGGSMGRYLSRTEAILQVGLTVDLEICKGRAIRRSPNGADRLLSQKLFSCLSEIREGSQSRMTVHATWHGCRRLGDPHGNGTYRIPPVVHG